MITIIRSKRKTIGFSFTPKGEILMRIPNTLPHDHIPYYLKQKEQWLVKTYHTIIQQEILQINLDLHHDGNIHLLGNDRKITFAIDIQQRYQLDNDSLTFYVHHIPTQKRQSSYIHQWLKMFSLEYYQQRTQELIHFFDPSLTMPHICIRKMRRSWGNMRKNHKMTLAQALIHLPQSAIDHVILHELCHIIHFNHSAKFHELLQSVDEAYDENIHILKQYQHIMA